MHPAETVDALPWSSTTQMLRRAFHDEVATNPLPATVKQRVLERTLGGRKQVKQLMAAMGAQQLHAPDQGESDFTTRETLSMDLLDHAHCDAESIEALRNANGAAFPAWAHLLAFASYARWAMIGMPLEMREALQ